MTDAQRRDELFLTYLEAKRNVLVSKHYPVEQIMEVEKRIELLKAKMQEVNK